MLIKHPLIRNAHRPPLVDHYKWIEDGLKSRMKGCPASLDVRFDFHITQYNPAEPKLLEKVATLARTSESSTLSGSSQATSTEDSNEKEKRIDDGKRSEHGFDGLIHWHGGRADLRSAIQASAEQAMGLVSVHGEP